MSDDPIILCPACKGEGHIGADYCKVCRGDGFAHKSRIDGFAASHGAPRHACHEPHCRPLWQYLNKMEERR